MFVINIKQFMPGCVFVFAVFVQEFSILSVGDFINVNVVIVEVDGVDWLFVIITNIMMIAHRKLTCWN